MKILNIIETAYRATLEEQDDTVVWLSHALKGAEADLDIWLQGSAVNYLVTSQDVSGLKIGTCRQTQAPQILNDIQGLLDKGCGVFAISEDLQERGITADETLSGICFIARCELAGSLEQYQQVWHW